MTDDRLLFPSEEWIQKYVELLNANDAYADAASWWEGDFVFEITADGEVIAEPQRFYLDLWHGKCRKAHMVDESTTAEYKYSGPYKNWKLLFEGKIDPIKGIMARKFRLDGDMGMVMRATKAAAELVKTATMVPTKFIDEE
ncbi:MAG: SCP2 sterol-binding domain-containing protein [Candidatus Thorarchaeota archaeon]|nr:MAG: SCP2 sterol-binding domain-containing protein [Candidatus Thorarchaeota archaeon]